ncbi:hypothetical protein GCM10017044_25760 [Kordiimonas sediminis]|uniref:DUF6468 domain-containing protein n=1 Tax=Kordiimonas sediminis TaxID=1735581 RepID=A0A919AYA5_9PROT|nr:DUF6468 domain-containing protein [Kordiimonas sediminis]GHF29357.1 hypothetical protein GCM10017044_25760 [Kordiimonas sediminis]
MNDMAILVIDGILVVLLLAAIVACILVYRRMMTIREGQAELKALVDNLNIAISEAQKSVTYLKTSSTDIEDTLKTQMIKGRALADEMAVIIEAGNNLADRIEQGLTGPGRAGAKIGSVSNDILDEDETDPERNAEQRALLEALREAR